MGFLDKAGMMRTAMDMTNVAKEFVAAITEIGKANRHLMEYVADHPHDVPVELHDLILKMDKATSLLLGP